MKFVVTIARLQIFRWVPRRNDFQVKFKELLEYKKAYGNVDVPYNNSISNPYRNLGRWVASLRLTKERLSNKEQDGSIVVEGKKRGGQRNDHLNIERIQVSIHWRNMACWVVLGVNFFFLTLDFSS